MNIHNKGDTVANSLSETDIAKLNEERIKRINELREKNPDARLSKYLIGQVTSETSREHLSELSAILDDSYPSGRNCGLHQVSTILGPHRRPKRNLL